MNDVKKCPHCGKQIHSSAQYCMFCMHTLVPKQDITPRISGTGKKSFAGIFLPAVALSLVLGLIVVGMLYRKKPQPPTKNNTAVQQDPTKSPVAQTEGQPVVNPEPPYSEPTAENTQPDSTPDPNVPSTPVENAQPDSTPDPNVPSTPVENTQPDSTPDPNAPSTPVENDPNTDDTPAVQQPTCTHSYTAASCIAPITCKDCGDTIGDIDPSAHNWKPEYALIHHDQVGHYEMQEVLYQKKDYLCFFCGYNQDGYDSMEDLRAHITVHANATDYAYVTSRPDLLAETRQVWASKDEQVWVVDQEAYDETRLVGYTCSLCGSKKEAQ